MQIYYVEIFQKVEHTFAEYSYNMFFDSEKSMKNFIEFFNDNPSSLCDIKKHGKAMFNKRGILVPM